jgi:hypothetical protein
VAKIKVYKLLDEPEEDFRLIGIATTLKEYKIGYELNRILNTEFEKKADIQFENKERGRTLSFGLLMAANEQEDVQYFIFNNRNLGETLLPQLSDYDYLLKIEGNVSAQQISAALEGIKALKEVIICAEIPLDKIKQAGRLRTDYLL